MRWGRWSPTGHFPGSLLSIICARQCDHKNYDDLAFSVRRIIRALTSGAYRRRSIPLDREDLDNEELEDEALLSPEARALTKPYFEVLFVDNVSEQQDRWLRSSIQRMHRTEDAFTYQPVIVPSLEDALIAILFNHNIQAVVVASRRYAQVEERAVYLAAISLAHR